MVWEWHLRPVTGEPGVLPAIELVWFDSIRRDLATTTIAAIPFGYASFDLESGRGAGFATGAVLGLGVAAAAGFGLGVLVLLGDRRLRFRAGLTALRTRQRQRRLRRRIRRALRAGDIPALGRALAALPAGRGPEPAEIAHGRALLEAHLFAPRAGPAQAAR